MSKRLLVPPRGSINDRNGIELATNNQNFQAILIPEQARKIDNLLENIRNSAVDDYRPISLLIQTTDNTFYATIELVAEND